MIRMNSSDLFFDNECLDMCVLAFWRRSRVFDMAAQAIVNIINNIEQKRVGDSLKEMNECIRGRTRQHKAHQSPVRYALTRKVNDDG